MFKTGNAVAKELTRVAIAQKNFGGVSKYRLRVPTVSCNNWSNIHASHAEFLQRLAQSARAVLDSNLFRPAYFSTDELPAEAWLHGRLDPSHTHL